MHTGLPSSWRKAVLSKLRQQGLYGGPESTVFMKPLTEFILFKKNTQENEGV